MKSEAIIPHKGTSELAKAILDAVKSQPSFEPEAYDACQPKDVSKCTLARGIENLFVTGIMQRIFHRISKKREQWTFEECFYMPSTHIEGRCGFDVSIGNYKRSFRVRLMHKLIQRWCDADWQWSLGKREKQHIGLITNQCWKSKKANAGGYIRPFASFSICYCLHDYRRIGTENVPGFEDEKRHLFIDLEPLSKSKLQPDKLQLSIQRRGGMYLIHSSVGGKDIDLAPLSWDEFLKEAIDPLM
jgi:hypothetical protein